MIRLNSVTTGKHCVERGLFSTDNDLYKELTHRNFKMILQTNATMDEGEDDVVKYFKVQKQWNELLFQWKEEGKVVIDVNVTLINYLYIYSKTRLAPDGNKERQTLLLSFLSSRMSGH